MIVKIFSDGKEIQHSTFHKDEVMIGRDSDNDIVLESNSVSRHHARLEYRNGNIWINDLNSTNGTLVNGEKLKALVELSGNDTISIGEYTLNALSAATDEATAVISSDLALEIIAPVDEKRKVHIPQKREVIIGRHPDCDIKLEDKSVSGKHATIIKENGKFIISDTGSTNGTFINGKKIEEEQIRDGDILEIGRFKCRVSLKGTKGEYKKEKKRRSGQKIRILLLLTLLVASGLFLLKPKVQLPNDDKFSEELYTAIASFEEGSLEEAEEAFKEIEEKYPDRTEPSEYLKAIAFLDRIRGDIDRFYEDNNNVEWAKKDALSGFYDRFWEQKNNKLIYQHKISSNYLEKVGTSIYSILEKHSESKKRREWEESYDYINKFKSEDFPNEISKKLDELKEDLKEKLKPPKPKEKPKQKQQTTIPEQPEKPVIRPFDYRVFFNSAKEKFKRGEGESALGELNKIPQQELQREKEILTSLIREILEYYKKKEYENIIKKLSSDKDNWYYREAEKWAEEEKARRLYDEAKKLFVQMEGSDASQKLQRSTDTYYLPEANELKGLVDRILMLWDLAKKTRDNKTKKCYYKKIIEEIKDKNNLYSQQAEIEIKEIEQKEAEKLYNEAKKRWDDGEFDKGINYYWTKGNSKELVSIKEKLTEARKLCSTEDNIKNLLKKAETAISNVNNKQIELYRDGYSMEYRFPESALRIYKDITKNGISETVYYKRAEEGIERIKKRLPK